MSARWELFMATVTGWRAVLLAAAGCAHHEEPFHPVPLDGLASGYVHLGNDAERQPKKEVQPGIRRGFTLKARSKTIRLTKERYFFRVFVPWW